MKTYVYYDTGYWRNTRFVIKANNKKEAMKTVYDVVKCICDSTYRTPLYNSCNGKMLKLTVMGNMINISIMMILGGEY